MSEQEQQLEFKPGDVFWVKVGRKRYKTVIDEHKVQRFEQVPAIRTLADEEPDVLNKRVVAYQQGHLSLTEFLEFDMALGYSVSGLADVIDSLMYMWRNPTGRRRQLTISNPLWRNGEPQVWRSRPDPTTWLINEAR